jgi:peptidoglycan/LPS O-acetylase OafA/YrhL
LTTPSRDNNFDLLRIIAAIQIAVYHCYEHLHFSSPVLNNVLYATRFVIGIPVLFTISGFLIFFSYERAPNLKTYFKNRFLRIYPGLWACLLFTIFLLIVFGYLNWSAAGTLPFWSWLITQLTFLQFYTPELFRHFGTGTPNGSLWTIPVEIGFYIFIPLMLRISGKKTSGRNVHIVIWAVLSFAFNIWYQQYKFSDSPSTLSKLPGVSAAPYLFYFLFGALAANNWERIKKWYEGKGLVWIAVYALYSFVFCVVLKKYEIGYWTNTYHLVSMLLLSQSVISLAYTFKSVGCKLLGRNDYSLGIYLYHMPVINVLLTLGIAHTNLSFLYVTLIVCILAFLSWKYIEQPALATKRNRT